MGSVVGKAMDDNMKKQQEFMLEQQSVMMERQLQMQNQMRERQAAMMLARSRDLFLWFSTFYGVTVAFSLIGMMKFKKPGAIVPLIPMTFILGYQWDLAHGTKMQRCREEADSVLDKEPGRILLPHGLPTLASIDAARLRSK